MIKQKPKIFLSYAREDIGMAKQLYNDLKRYGLNVWLDTESLLPGDRWKDKIQDAIENSNYFIALLSTKSVNKKGFVQKELKTALEVLDLFPSSERFILPVRLDDCEVGERKLKEHQWVDLFPDNVYQNGLKKILQVISPGTFLLRRQPTELSYANVNELLLKHDFYSINLNPEGKGFKHIYKLQENIGYQVLFDEITKLIWERDGTFHTMQYKDAKEYINRINSMVLVAFDDWRLPTLEEAMSLMEPKEKRNVHIDPIFDNYQKYIWTADREKGSSKIWIVDFSSASCRPSSIFHMYYVRAVCSGQSKKSE